MPIQFPGRVNHMNPAGIEQAAQTAEWNALRNEGQRDINTMRRQTFDDQTRLDNTRWGLAATKLGMDAGAEWVRQNWGAFADQMAQRGMVSPEDLPNPMELDDDTLMEGFKNLHESFRIGLSGQQSDIDKNDLVPVMGAEGPEYVMAPDAVGQEPVSGTSDAKPPAMLSYYQQHLIESKMNGTQPMTWDEYVPWYQKQAAYGRVQGAQQDQPTTLQTKIDERFADEYITLTSGGGLADAQKAITQLDDVYADLVSGKNLSGIFISLQPRKVLAVTNPEALDTREQVEEIVQRNLRLILGAQFTEKEGTRLIERAYNPALEEEYNAVRVQRLFDQIRTAARVKLKMVKHYERHGTLRGFDTSQIPEIEDFYRALELRKGDVVEGHQYLGGNPENRNNWRKVE